MNTIAKLTLAMVAVATSGVLTKAQADSIVGTWRLISWIEEETESKAVHKNFGDNPLGFITYTSDGHMMIMFTDPARKPTAFVGVKDDHLTIKTPPFVSPFLNKQIVATLVWERAK